MTRCAAALWLIVTAIALLNLHFSCPAHGQEIARVPVSEGIVAVERDGDVIRVVITSGGATTTIEVPVESTPAEPGPGQPPPNDPIARVVDRELEAIPPGLRPRVLEQIAEEIRHTIDSIDRITSSDDAVRLITSRAIFNLDEIGPTLAQPIARIAGTLHDETIPEIAGRLARLAHVIEERR